MAGVGIATGSAMRRRQRRLRQWHRHERMTVALALAEVTHHAAPRGPKTARAQEEVERETYNVPRHLKTPPLGTRPAPLAEVGRRKGQSRTGTWLPGAPRFLTDLGGWRRHGRRYGRLSRRRCA